MPFKKVTEYFNKGLGVGVGVGSVIVFYCIYYKWVRLVRGECVVIFLGVEKLCNHVDDCDGMLSETTVLTSRSKSKNL